MYYLKGRAINQQKREAIENAIVAAAGLYTMEHKRGTAEQCNIITFDCYRSIMCSFHSRDFNTSNVGLESTMMDCLKHAQGSMTGEKLWNKFNTITKDLCIMYTQIKTFPHDIPSNKQLSDIYREWIALQYKECEV